MYSAYAYVFANTPHALPLPVRRRWSPLASPQPDTSTTLQSHRYGIMYHAMYFRRVLFSLPTEGGLRLSRPRCLVLHRGGLPIQRRSPSRH